MFGRTAVVERITSRAYSVTGQMDRVLERRGRVGRLSPGLWRSCVMSVSSEPDPEGRQGSVGSRLWNRRAAALTGPVRLSMPMATLRTAAVTCGVALPAGR